MDISGVLSGLAFLGLLAFLGGVLLVVLSASQGRPVRSGISFAIVGIVVFLLFSVVSSGIVSVQPQNRAVVFNVLSGSLQDPPLGSGTHVVIPILYEYTIYPVRQQEYTMLDSSSGGGAGGDGVVARTSDGQEIRLDVTVLYNLDPAKLNEVHQRWQNTYEQQFVRPTVRNIIRMVVSEYAAEGIYGTNRAAMEERVEQDIATAFEREGLQLTDLLIREINFRAEFADAIERKEIEAQELARARTEAERIETQARGRANAAIETARGAAEATILNAQAQAESLRLVSEQIAANPSLIQYEYIRHLAGNINMAIIPSNSPFLFDFDSLAQADSDFSAPAVPEFTLPETSNSVTDPVTVDEDSE